MANGQRTEIDHNEPERRVLMGRVEYRDAEGEGSIGGIVGNAAVIGEETVIGEGFWAFREIIAPGAFKDAIKADDVRALFNHDPNHVLGRTASKTLRLEETKDSLRYEADLPDTGPGRDVLTLIKRGDIDGSSFAFTVAEADEEWDESEVKKGKLPLRTINRISKLYDVSPATYPAYPTTSVSVRSRAKASAERRDALVEPRMALADEPKAPDIVAREQARAAVEEAKAWRR